MELKMARMDVIMKDAYCRFRFSLMLKLKSSESAGTRRLVSSSTSWDNHKHVTFRWTLKCQEFVKRVTILTGYLRALTGLRGIGICCPVAAKCENALELHRWLSVR